MDRFNQELLKAYNPVIEIDEIVSALPKKIAIEQNKLVPKRKYNYSKKFKRKRKFKVRLKELFE
jgi:hypothetical protein